MRAGLLLLAFATFTLIGCKPKAPDAANTLIIVNREAEAERMDFCNSVRAMLLNRAYDMLDSTAADLRANDRRFSNGDEKLRAFYLDGLGKAARERSEGLWARQIARLREWRAMKPQSITAAVGLAYGLSGYGWHARGSGYADTVTPEGLRLMDQRVAESWKVLQEARALKETCPGWYIAASGVALSQGWDPVDCDRLWRDALEFDPHYSVFYELRAHHLLPRWYGEAGDWERFAFNETRPLPGEEADIVYARIVSAQMKYYADILNETEVDWARTRHGLQTLIQRYPSSVELKSRLCLLAIQAGDHELARLLFGELGDQVAINVWKSGERFLEYRAEALKATSKTVS